MSEPLFTDTERQQLRAMIVTTLNDEGCQPGSSMHSWRCEDKDRYPEPCTCVAEAADQILIAASWSAVGPAVVARIRRNALRDAAEQFRRAELQGNTLGREWLLKAAERGEPL